MSTKYAKILWSITALVITIWVIWYANSVFLLAFAGILLAIFLNSIGKAAKKVTRLPYPIALAVALLFILGILTLTFWLYSPLIADQFLLLMKQLPQAAENFRSTLTPYFGTDFLSQTKLRKEFSDKFLTQLLSFFSTTIGSIAGFIIFVIVGFYLAFDPDRYMNWMTALIPAKRQKKVRAMMNIIGQSLRWWILGKLLSMAVVGVLTFIGLSVLHVSLAFILGLLSALLTFIPYVGAILAAIPAILIAFAQSPMTALYVTILYVVIHVIDGYFITPSIEQRTVSIPPGITILAQVLMVVLIGGIGLALATPLAVVAIALVRSAQSTFKVVQQTEQPHYD